MATDAKVQIGNSQEFLEGVYVDTGAGLDLFREGVVISDPTLPDARAKVELDGLVTRDYFKGGEVLATLTANVDGVLSFQFSAPVQLVYVYSEDHQNHLSRVDPFGGVPSATTGIPLDPAVPLSFPVQTSSVKVYEQAGGSVTVWGYRY